MKAVFHPSSARGAVSAPPSKTFAHRLLIAAALGTGPCSVGPLAYSEDVLATLDCIRALGARATAEGPYVRVFPDGEPSDLFPCRESGSTLRFFLPLCLLRDTECVLTGSERLLERPLGVYEDICREQGLLFERRADGIHVRGPLKPGEFRVRGDVSSQFITGLLFALPRLGGDSVLRIEPPIVSIPYIDITLSILRKAGILARWSDDGALFVPGNQTYRPTDGQVEGDYSNAAFLEAFNLIGGEVSVGNLNPDSLQGDVAYREDYPKLAEGCPEIDLSDTPDLAPVLMALGGALHGVVLLGTSRLKIKESDRGAAMAEELAKFGVHAEVEENRIRVFPAVPRRPETPVNSHNDHRIAMACSLLLTLTGGELEGAEAVRKSWPDYYEAVRSLGIQLEWR